METVLLASGEPGTVPRAAAALAAGELVALPTETVYGLAADASNLAAVAAIFQAKERPLFDPLIVHLPEPGWLERLTLANAAQTPLVRRLTAAFWPGPLTVILPRRPDAVPDLVTAGSPQVAVRMSAHPVFRAVIEAFGRPLAAPSANRFGRISPTTGAHVMAELAGRVSLVVEAGPTAHGVESTVILPAEDGKSLSILRHGPITHEMLAPLVRVTAATPAAPDALTAAPGQTAGHYAPRTPLRLLDADPFPGEWSIRSSRGARLGFLGFRADRPPPPDVFQRVESLSAAGDLLEAATRFFAALRRLDDAGLDLIVAEPVPERDLGRAIMERLRRAAVGSGPGGAFPGVGDQRA